MSSEPRTFSKGLLFGLLLSASPYCMLLAEGNPLPINDNLPMLDHLLREARVRLAA